MHACTLAAFPILCSGAGIVAPQLFSFTIYAIYLCHLEMVSYIVKRFSYSNVFTSWQDSFGILPSLQVVRKPVSWAAVNCMMAPPWKLGQTHKFYTIRIAERFKKQIFLAATYDYHIVLPLERRNRVDDDGRAPRACEPWL